MIALFIVGWALFINGIYQLIKYFIIVSEIKAGSKKIIKDLLITPSGAPHKIFVLAPVLHEEKIVGNFLLGLSQQNYPKDSYKVYVITTQKEYLSLRMYS